MKRCEWNEHFDVMFVVATAMVVAVGACNDGTGSGWTAGCQSDDDCRGARVCASGSCRPPTVTDATDGGADASPRDSRTGTDGIADDGSADLGGSDAGRDGTGPVPDGDDGGAPAPDAMAPDGGGASRPLSCHEFATCQHVGCEQFDYGCREKLADRTSSAQLQQLDDRQRCIRDHCAGTTGLERASCIDEHCAEEWEACGARPGNGESLDCGEFHSCLSLCNGVENRQQCRADCQTDATSEAQMRLGDYQRCVTARCSGREGRDRLECIRDNCRTELDRCWRC